MLKFIESRWSNYNTLRLLHSSSTQTDSLFLRISRAGGPNNSTKPSRMDEYLLSGDIAIRLDLISKVRDLDEAEKYFNSIPHTSKDFKVYGALLNCYAQYNFVTKAESIMKHVKKRASNHAPDLVLSYNVLLKLYTRTGQHEKLVALMKEMKDKKMYDNYTLTSWLNAYASTNNIAEMEKLLAKMEVDHRTTLDWLVYSAAADGYIKACQFDKSLAMLKKSEQLIKGNSKSSVYASLLTKYAAIGKKNDVYRIWNICKILNGSRNSIYISMLMSLSQLNDIDGAETILEEWQSGNTCFDIRILNVMISVYCKNGMLEKAEAYVAKLLERDNKLDGRIWDRLACG